MLINDERASVNFDINWKVILSKNIIGKGATKIAVEPGETGQVPIEFIIPKVSGRESGEIEAKVTGNGKSAPISSFAFQVYPEFNFSKASYSNWGIYDPKGKTTLAIKQIGISIAQVDKEGTLSKDLKVLIIGAEALSENTPIFFKDLAERIKEGMQVIFFEQTGEVLERIFGLRTITRGTRQVWIRDREHPFMKDLKNEDLGDWRGKTTLGPIDGLPETLEESQRAKFVWRCSQREQ